MDDYAYVLMGIMINMERLGATLIDEPNRMLKKRFARGVKVSGLRKRIMQTE